MSAEAAGELVYPISIADYRPDWGVWEGLREAIYQEYMDLFKGNWTIKRYGQHVVIEGQGPVFDLDSLILGISSKRGQKGMRGEHGEGTKMGWMVFLREGIEFELQSGSRAFWAETVELHGQTCMKVCWRKLKKPVEGARYQLTYEGPMYEDRIVKDEDRIFTDESGRSILSKPGLFVKGIWVQRGHLVENLHWGYNLVDQQLDLSRKMVNAWNARTEVGKIWAQVEDVPLIKKFLEVATEEGERFINLNHVQNITPWREAWKLAYGASAVVETDKTSAREATWRGAETVDVGTANQFVLGAAVGTDRKWIADRTQSETVYINDRALDSGQRRVIRWLRTAVQRHTPAYNVQAATLEYADGRTDRLKKLILIRPEVLELPLVAAEVTAHELDHMINGSTDLTADQTRSVAQLAVELFCRNVPRY